MSYFIIAVATIYCVGYLGSLFYLARWVVRNVKKNDMMPSSPTLGMIGVIGCAVVSMVLNLFYPLLALYYSARILDDI